MISPRHNDSLTAVSLAENCFYLPPNGPIRRCAKTPEFFRAAGIDPDLVDGRIVALHIVNRPEDVHYPIWEMHPEGDELLVVCSGLVFVEIRDKVSERTVPLPPRTAFIVPARLWHRLAVQEPSVLIAITPRRNTAHDPGHPEVISSEPASDYCDDRRPSGAERLYQLKHRSSR